MRVRHCTIFKVIVEKDFALSFVGVKGFFTSILRKQGGRWNVLGAEMPTKATLVRLGASSATALAVMRDYNAYLSPKLTARQVAYNSYLGPANTAAYTKGDMPAAISAYERAGRFASSRCEHEYVRLSTKAARETLSLIKSGKIAPGAAANEYRERESGYWMHTSCNGP